MPSQTFLSLTQQVRIPLCSRRSVSYTHLAAGLHISGIESVNVHDAIKTGAPDRDLYIDHYIETLENLGKEDIHLVCYNFMPVFDWTRTALARTRPDGSTVLALSLIHI